MNKGEWYKEDQSHGKWALAHLLEERGDKWLCHFYALILDCFGARGMHFSDVGEFEISGKSIGKKGKLISEDEANKLIDKGRGDD